MTAPMMVLRGFVVLVGLLGMHAAWAAQIMKVQGVVQVARAGQVLSSFEGQRLQEGDVIETSTDSETLIRFDGWCTLGGARRE